MSNEEEVKQWRAQVLQTRREKMEEGERLWTDVLDSERSGFVKALVSTDDQEERKKIHLKIQELEVIQQAQKDEDEAAAAATATLVPTVIDVTALSTAIAEGMKTSIHGMTAAISKALRDDRKKEKEEALIPELEPSPEAKPPGTYYTGMIDRTQYATYGAMKTLADPNPNDPRNKQLRDEFFDKMEKYDEDHSAEMFKQEVKEQLQPEMLEMARMEVANQMVNFDSKPKRRQDQLPDPQFGTNTSKTLPEGFINKHLKGAYYHHKEECSTQILNIIRMHADLVRILKLHPNNCYGLFERFIKKEGTRMGVLITNAALADTPLKEFYETLLGEFDGEYDELTLRQRLEGFIARPHKMPLEKVLNSIDAYVTAIYQSVKKEEFTSKKTNAAVDYIRRYLILWYPPNGVSELHTRWDLFVASTGVKIGTNDYLAKYRKQVEKRFGRVDPGPRKRPPAYLTNTESFSLGFEELDNLSNVVPVINGQQLMQKPLIPQKVNQAGNQRGANRQGAPLNVSAIDEDMDPVFDTWLPDEEDEDDEILEEVAAIQENAGQNPGGNRDFRDFRNRRPNEFVPRPNPGTGNAGPGNVNPMAKPGPPTTNTQSQNQSKVWTRPTFEEMRTSGCWRCGLKDHMKEDCWVIPDREWRFTPKNCQSCNALHVKKPEDGDKCVVLEELRAQGWTIMPYSKN